MEQCRSWVCFPLGVFLSGVSMLACVCTVRQLSTFSTFDAMGISTSAHVHVKEKIVRPHGGAACGHKSPLTAAQALVAESIQLLELSRVGGSGQFAIV